MEVARAAVPHADAAGDLLSGASPALASSGVVRGAANGAQRQTQEVQRNSDVKPLARKRSEQRSLTQQECKRLRGSDGQPRIFTASNNGRTRNSNGQAQAAVVEARQADTHPQPAQSRRQLVPLRQMGTNYTTASSSSVQSASVGGQGRDGTSNATEQWHQHNHQHQHQQHLHQHQHQQQHQQHQAVVPASSEQPPRERPVLDVPLMFLPIASTAGALSGAGLQQAGHAAERRPAHPTFPCPARVALVDCMREWTESWSAEAGMAPAPTGPCGPVDAEAEAQRSWTRSQQIFARMVNQLPDNSWELFQSLVSGCQDQGVNRKAPTISLAGLVVPFYTFLFEVMLADFHGIARQELRSEE